MPQDVRIGDLQKLAVLGAGAFGQVMLVKHEGKYLALKTLSKQQIMEMGLQVPCRALLCLLQPEASCQRAAVNQPIHHPVLMDKDTLACRAGLSRMHACMHAHAAGDYAMRPGLTQHRSPPVCLVLDWASSHLLRAS